MTEPTEQEIREMAAWAGIDYDVWDGYALSFEDDGPKLIAWKDGRLLWAMHTKLREHSPVDYGYKVLYDGDWHDGEDDAECLWAACREFRK